MGEGPIVAVARRLDELARVRGDWESLRRRHRGDPLDPVVAAVADIPGVVYRMPASAPPPAEAVELPTAEAVAGGGEAQARAFALVERHRGRRQTQICAGMRVVANPPWPPLTQAEIDRVYALPFSRDAHPIYAGRRIPALEMVRWSVTSHRGCFGGCAFCAIGAHQGKRIQSRSPEAILDEVGRIAAHPEFGGTVSDVGGPTANMYGLACRRDEACDRPSCLWPRRCRHLDASQLPYAALLEAASRVQGVRHLFVSTGIRMDLAMLSDALLSALAFRHTSGHLKVAPEHVSPRVLKLMRKPAAEAFPDFLARHRELSARAGRKQYVVPYLMAAHPGCALEDMIELALYLRRERLTVEQVQIFTPTPGTASTAMYATGLDPQTQKPVFVERDPRRKQMQKALLLGHLQENHALIREALALAGRPELAPQLIGAGRAAPRRRS